MEITDRLYSLFLQSRLVTTDSRKVPGGALFFALKGEHFDGNRFAEAALQAGAAVAVVDDPAAVIDERCLLVDNALKALQDLARHHRRRFFIPLIGLTGSNGKTTTKELIANVLATTYRTHFTQGNLNNHIGVPLTLLKMPDDAEVAVIEMGANHQGEIDFLCRIAEPTHGLITNIGKAHLEGFGGLEGVKKGKSELYRYLAETNGLAFVNQDDPVLMELSEVVPKRVFYCQSEDPDPDYAPYESVLLQEAPRIKVGFLDKRQGMMTAETHLFGRYNFLNMMAAVALGKYFKVPGANIKKALESYLPENNRSQRLTWRSNTFILDAYNANPSSMENALRYFAQEEQIGKKKVIIIGDMLELGDTSSEEHEAITALAEELGAFDEMYFVGPIFEKAAASRGLPHFPTVEALGEWFVQQNWEHTAFLLKASRSIGLEKLVRYLAVD